MPLPERHWQMPFADNLFLRGEFLENEGKPVLCFAHGNGLATRTYWPFLEQFTSDYALLLYNFADHGPSDPEPFIGWDGTATRYASNLAQWDFGAREVIGMGHSFGSVVSLIAAQQSFPAPRFSRLVLLDPVIPTPSMVLFGKVMKAIGLIDQHPLAVQARQRTATWPSMEDARSYLYKRGIFRSWDDRAFDWYMDANIEQREGHVGLMTHQEHEAAIFGSVMHRIWRDMKKVQIPIDALYGHRTYRFVRLSMWYLDTFKKNFNKHRIDGTHCFMQEAPEASAEAVKQILAR